VWRIHTTSLVECQGLNDWVSSSSTPWTLLKRRNFGSATEIPKRDHGTFQGNKSAWVIATFGGRSYVNEACRMTKRLCGTVRTNGIVFLMNPEKKRILQKLNQRSLKVHDWTWTVFVSFYVGLWETAEISELSRATGWKTAVQFPAEARNFSLLYSIQTGSGPTQLPIQWVPRTPFPGVKWPGREADQSPLSNSKLNNGESYFHFHIPHLQDVAEWQLNSGKHLIWTFNHLRAITREIRFNFTFWILLCHIFRAFYIVTQHVDIAIYKPRLN
jgi:hypothetical protein